MQLCDLSIHINGLQIFFLNQRIVSRYSGKLKKIIRQENRNNLSIEIDEFPGGPEGFEMVSRFCYNNGRIDITVSNVCVLHCCAIFLGMSEKISEQNLLKQTEKFLEEVFLWSWNEILITLKSCEFFFYHADSCGLVQKLVSALISKVSPNSDSSFLVCSSSSSSSPETTSGFRLSSSAKTTPESRKPFSSSGKQWWFDDLVELSPLIIERFFRNLGAYGRDNNSLILTRFIIHYLKNRIPSKNCEADDTAAYSGLADTAVHGVIAGGKSAFSCRGLLLILRTVSAHGASRESRDKLERLIGSKVDKATLDDLLISGAEKGGYYDVKLVMRLIEAFVSGSEVVCEQKMKKVGKLIDKYLGEISPDPNLEVSIFVGVAESLPDCARDCFDGVYRAIDMYLQSHPTLSSEERTRICECLNYEKLSLEACKEVAKNPRTPPHVAIEALKSQRFNTSIIMNGEQDNEDIKINIKKMHKRVFELERAYKQMKAQMSMLVKYNNTTNNNNNFFFSPNRALPRLCSDSFM